MATIPPPESIQLIGTTVAIRWKDEREDYYEMENLRKRKSFLGSHWAQIQTTSELQHRLHRIELAPEASQTYLGLTRSHVISVEVK